jgi:hypothetical protein
MTVPLSDPNDARKFAEHGYRIRQLERRPSPISQLPISVLGLAGARSQSMSGLELNIEFDLIYRNDDSFTYEEVTSSRARYITISQEGWYHAKFAIFWNSDFTAGDAPLLRPTAFVSGFQNNLINIADQNWNDYLGINASQLVNANLVHHIIACDVLFNFVAADWGDSEVGIGMKLQANANRTKNFGGTLAITRLGGVLTELVIT